jgi:CBS domain containing-hemolysin-like protein
MVTREDVAAMADLGEIEGALDEAEETIIHNLLELRNVMVDDEMTPRTVVEAFEENHTIAEVLKENTILRFSRIPVYEDHIDNVRGLVIRSEILMAASRDEWELQLKDIKKPILKLELGASIEQALDLFLKEKQQFALIRDEFGGTSGILTMEDVMEKLLGEQIVDELDPVVDMRELARTQANEAEE